MPDFSIIIPPHNEENRIGDTLEQLSHFLRKNYRKNEFEIIIIDDGKDRTEEIAERFKREEGNGIRLIHFEKRLGKGKALLEGMEKAKGECLITYDADGATPASEIPKMLRELKNNDIVIGSRMMCDSKIFGRVPLKRRLASKGFNFLGKLLFGIGAKDTQCGFKGIRKSAFEKLKGKFVLGGFEWDVELLARAKKNGMKMREIGIEWHHKKEGKVKVTDTLGMLLGLLKLRMGMLKGN